MSIHMAGIYYDIVAATRWDAFKFWLYCRWRWAGVHGLLGPVRLGTVVTRKDQT